MLDINDGRADKISMNGTMLSPVMDVSTSVRFQPLGNGDAAVKDPL
jgi:hypothetical protein